MRRRSTARASSPRPPGQPQRTRHTRRFRDVAAVDRQVVGALLVLDGEVAIYDQQLRSRVDWLRDPDQDAVASPPVLMAFDILYYDGRDLTQSPLRDRRARLEDVGRRQRAGGHGAAAAPDRVAAWRQVVECGYEGYVAKDEAGVNEAGPTKRWLKVKQKSWAVTGDGRRRIVARISRTPGARWR